MPVQSVLVEYEEKSEGKVYANSGCLISKKYVLITSNILTTLIASQDNLKTTLKSLKSGLSSPQTIFKSTPEINVVINENPYLSKRANIIAVYVSDYIRNEAKRFFNDWSIDEDSKAQQLKEILSLFFIASIEDTDRRTIDDDLIQCLREISMLSQRIQIKTGNKIIIEGTPFGNRNFLRSQSRGIISNVFGQENCFILTDTPTAPGSEGSPMFLKSKTHQILPIGIVLASLSWWKGEWIGLTLGSSFSVIFSDILPEATKLLLNKEDNDIAAVHDTMKYSVVLIVSGANWGSGILLDKENGIFITNSHVVETKHPLLIWNDIEIKSRVLYKNSENEIYDVAILVADLEGLNKTKMQSVPISPNQILVGESIFAVGFPLFPRALKPKPTLTSGHVTQITSTMIKTSCTVLPGSSGGAVLRKTGQLIGIIVCNARMGDNFVATPRINMAIPILGVIDPIRSYAKTKDVAVLKKLKIENLSARKEWNFLKSNL